ncbi:biotin-dependent carboxyltransferase [Paenibacillaceae bacterium]|nr:biotin-dependent carboxyltransferase [Paenibacillaceae bacterium]
MEWVTVIKPGFFTTVQDLGRRHLLRNGVSASGAMDPLSLRLGNLLVGNEEGAAALEVTMAGPKLRFSAAGAIAITGGDLSPAINGRAVPMWQSLAVRPADELTFGACRNGCRSYLCLAGGVEVPEAMGSRSTFQRGGYGGMNGRALMSGDQLPVGVARYPIQDVAGRRLPPESIPDYRGERDIRFILGPQDDAFTSESVECFLSEPYLVTNDSDRMGYRLQGAPLQHVGGADIISDYIAVGSIQVPAAGQPIVLMADCQVTGGYTKIGVIISADLGYTAQRKPGDRLRFHAVDVAYAHEQFKKQEAIIANLLRVNRMLAFKY